MTTSVGGSSGVFRIDPATKKMTQVLGGRRRINGVSFDPASLKLAKQLPSTADPCGKTQFGFPTQTNEYQAVGRADYQLNDKADVTVLIYREGKVAANHALAAGGLSDEAIKQIITDTSKILND